MGKTQSQVDHQVALSVKTVPRRQIQNQRHKFTSGLSWMERRPHQASGGPTGRGSRVLGALLPAALSRPSGGKGAFPKLKLCMALEGALSSPRRTGPPPPSWPRACLGGAHTSPAPPRPLRALRVLGATPQPASSRLPDRTTEGWPPPPSAGCAHSGASGSGGSLTALPASR